MSSSDDRILRGRHEQTAKGWQLMHAAEEGITSAFLHDFDERLFTKHTSKHLREGNIRIQRLDSVTEAKWDALRMRQALGAFDAEEDAVSWPVCDTKSVAMYPVAHLCQCKMKIKLQVYGKRLTLLLNIGYKGFS